jgi:hypothetical protein
MAREVREHLIATVGRSVQLGPQPVPDRVLVRQQVVGERGQLRCLGARAEPFVREIDRRRHGDRDLRHAPERTQGARELGPGVAELLGRPHADVDPRIVTGVLAQMHVEPLHRGARRQDIGMLRVRVHQRLEQADAEDLTLPRAP